MVCLPGLRYFHLQLVWLVELINNKINPERELYFSSIKVFEIPGESVYEYPSRRVLCSDWYFLSFILLASAVAHLMRMSKPIWKFLLLGPEVTLRPPGGSRGQQRTSVTT